MQDDPVSFEPSSKTSQSWLTCGGELGLDRPEQPADQHSWFVVMWLTGVDYFSSIAYQAGIALAAAGDLAPIATSVLVFVTLFCAVPVYREVARRSYAGQGSIALLENLVTGWYSKLLVLVLLGFAGTDFVITMTLSAADSAQHVTENPLLKPYVGHLHLAITIGLLVLLAAVFLKGFKEAITLAIGVGIPFILLNAIVVGRCLLEVMRSPSVWANWRAALHSHGQGWGELFIASCLVFPQLALGLSGFETGVSVMPLIKGDPEDANQRENREPDRAPSPPRGRIRNTGKLLITAALLMSVLLIASSIVTTLLIPPSAYLDHGPAKGRAIAYLAHRYLGNGLGSLYDLSTILILWFAGASAMAGLLNLIPRYLPRFGMASQWVCYPRPLVLVLFAINLIVTLVFRGDVERQGGAYATGVLVLILSAAVAAAISTWREAQETREHQGKVHGKALYFWICAAVFGYTLVMNIRERPDGIIIASIFIILLLITSLLSRYSRSTELRVRKCEFEDAQSETLWHQLSTERLNLIPISKVDLQHRQEIRAKVKKYYKTDGPITFVYVDLLDNRSDFYEQLTVRIEKHEGEYVIKVSNANVVANTIAYVSIALKARTILLHLTKQQSPTTRAFNYLVLGTGETGLMVLEILTNYWQRRPEADRPVLFLMTA
jgi:Rnf-Nqr subunit, membrane protein